MGRRVLIAAALVLGVVGGAQGRTTTISISVTTKNRGVDGLVWTTYGSPATITGRVGSGQGGVAVVLQRNSFPFKGGFSAVARTRTGAGGGYAFSPKPSLATRYRVALASRPALTSRAVTVYVGTRNISSGSCVNGPVCALHVAVDFIYPAAVAKQEAAKPAYFYLGVRHGSQTQAPERVNLVQTGRQERVGGNRFRARFATSFRTPGPYHYSWVVCARDTEAADGFKLPGHHHCGDRSIAYPAFQGYIG